MGSQVNTKFRGDDDVVLMNFINETTPDEFETFLQSAEEYGCLDASDYTGNKSSLINDLPRFEQSVKKSIIDNIQNGKPAF